MDHALIRSRPDTINPESGVPFYTDASPEQVVNQSFAKGENIEGVGGFKILEAGLYSFEAQVFGWDTEVTCHVVTPEGAIDMGGELVDPPALDRSASYEREVSLLPGDFIYREGVCANTRERRVGPTLLHRLEDYDSVYDFALHAGLRQSVMMEKVVNG